MRRILLVDDDVHLTLVIKKRLQRAGFDVRVTNRSFGVLNLVSSIRPDVVLMDIKMPGLQGSDLVKLLREHSELIATRVVLYSGMAKEELRTMCRDSGADGFVHKGDEFGGLLRAIE